MNKQQKIYKEAMYQVQKRLRERYKEIDMEVDRIIKNKRLKSSKRGNNTYRGREE